jgi:hypothetical protein
MKRQWNNHDKIKQPISFIGAENGMCSFTDMDAISEYKGKYLIIAEVKKVNNEIPTGQKLLIERLLDKWVRPLNDVKEYNELINLLRDKHNDFSKSPKQVPELDAWGFRVTHNQPDDKEIYLMDCVVEEYYHMGKWRELKSKSTFREVYDLLLNKWGVKKN